jgi:hypothetical protein
MFQKVRPTARRTATGEQESLIALITLLVAGTARAGASIPEPQNLNYCEVVTLPKDYDGKVLSVDVILVPSEHSLSLFGADCRFFGDINPPG